MNTRPLHVCLAGIPGALSSPVTGLYESFNVFPILRGLYDGIPETAPFEVEIVASEKEGAIAGSGLSLDIHRSIAEIDRTDIIIVPSMITPDGYDWKTGRYDDFVDWMLRMHQGGAILCSACSGALVLAETGLLHNRKATIHWAFAQTFKRNFPSVRLCLDEVLVTTGDRNELVMSGASASWHDLLLHLVARLVSPTSAQALSKFMLFEWHMQGQSPYLPLVPPTDHNDAAIRHSQEWLIRNYSVGNPVEAMAKKVSMSTRTFERRFKSATGHTPIGYVTRIRVEEAKRRLERTTTPIDKISWEVGYEDAAAFRRLFKRITRLSPSEYRHRFQIPV